MPGCAAEIRLSIIVPCLNEAARIAATLDSLQPLRDRGAELIVVDGGSSDGSAQLARPLADHVLTTAPGRARQMNTAAAAARGEVLLFLHADCALPADADHLILEGLKANGRHWGRFDVQLAGEHPLLPLIACTMNLRSRISAVATGDQGLFVTRELFDAAGGYAPIALMEDVEISKRLRRHGPPLCLRARMKVSARRWEQHGALRTVLLMWRLRLAYFLGADPATLASQYYDHREPETTRILVFAKAPVPGTVKTRLIPLLGAGRAAALQHLLTEHAITTAVESGLGKVELWCAPSARDPLLAAHAQRYDLTLASQCDGDLGARMSQAVTATLERAARVIIIGSDCPALTTGDLKRAAAMLEDRDAVFIPAEDGGYALIGLKRWSAQLFVDIPWSSDRVMAMTRERLRRMGWRWHELPPTWDVDRPADYERLCASGILPAAAIPPGGTPGPA